MKLPAEETAKKRPGAPRKTVRWGVNHAAGEFGLTGGTLSKRLGELNIIAGADGYFSTQQICDAVFGSKTREHTRKITEEADGRAMDNQIKARKLCEVTRVVKWATDFALIVKQHILGSDLPEDRQAELLKELEDVCSSHKVADAVCS